MAGSGQFFFRDQFFFGIVECPRLDEVLSPDRVSSALPVPVPQVLAFLHTLCNLTDGCFFRPSPGKAFSTGSIICLCSIPAFTKLMAKSCCFMLDRGQKTCQIQREGVISSSAKLACIRLGLFITCLFITYFRDFDNFSFNLRYYFAPSI